MFPPALLRAASLLAAMAATSDCSRLGLLTGPSPLWQTLLPSWSPYLVVQPDNQALGGYWEALTSLRANRAISGARISLSLDGGSAQTVNLVASLGIDIIGIVENADLFAPDVEGAFDRYRATYPRVKTFQIGNEITTSASTPMTIDQYIDVFIRVYSHVVETHPDVTLVSQATFGSGRIGSDDLAAEAAAFTAKGVSGSRVVLALNVYTETALSAYATVIPTIPSSFRIWATETGVPDPSGQIGFVTMTYPQLRGLLRADRIYWYALWAGDMGGDSGFSLIKNATQPPIAPGPLFQLLTQPQ